MFDKKKKHSSIESHSRTEKPAPSELRNAPENAAMAQNRFPLHLSRLSGYSVVTTLLPLLVKLVVDEGKSVLSRKVRRSRSAISPLLSPLAMRWCLYFLSSRRYLKPTITSLCSRLAEPGTPKARLWSGCPGSAAVRSTQDQDAPCLGTPQSVRLVPFAEARHGQ